MSDQPITAVSFVPPRPAHRMLGEREFALVAAAVQTIAPEWSVEFCGSDCDDRCLAVMPAAADDMLGPTFILHFVNDRVRLDQLRFDEVQPVVEGATLREAITILRGRLASLVLLTGASLAVRH